MAQIKITITITPRDGAKEAAQSAARDLSLDDGQRQILNQVGALLDAIFAPDHCPEVELEARQRDLLALLRRVMEEGKYRPLRPPLRRLLEPFYTNNLLRFLRTVEGFVG